MEGAGPVITLRPGPVRGALLTRPPQPAGGRVIWRLPDVRLPVLPGALCAEPGADGELWFDWARQPEAISICVRCPVRAACDAFATAEHITHGVWGAVPRWQGSDA